MSFELWLLVIGALLLVLALLHPLLARLPLTPTIIYLGIGVALGPAGFGALVLDPVAHGPWLHRAAEIAVIVSLFTVGLKLRISPFDSQLRPALCLATVSMVLTVALIALAATWWLDLPLGAAVLLGAILAPTDPVLASEVQVQDPRDRDKLRLTLSAEAGLNDGTAFPFVMLGLGLLGLHDLGAGGGRWWTIDVAWAIFGGLGIGALLGTGLGALMIRLQSRRAEPVAFGEYLVLGLIGISYGAALQLHAYGFLSVFAAALALRGVERRASPSDRVLDDVMEAAGTGQSPKHLAANPKTAPAYFAGVLLATNELLEHLLEVAVVLLVGAALLQAGIAPEAIWLAPLLFLVVRPLAALPVLRFRQLSWFDYSVVSWFGIRGIGSIYYLMFAVEKGLPEPLARQLVSITLTIVALSVVVHGISVSPFLRHYYGRQKAAR